MPAPQDPEIERLVWRLIERGSAYDVEALSKIYDDDQYLLFVRGDGSVDRVDRTQTLAKFKARHEAGHTPLSTEAELLHIEQQTDAAVVLLRRRMDPDAPSNLYELRLRHTPAGWKVSGETVTPWPTIG
ncbi:MAG: hypothetical protein ACRDLP_06985 [Solirubrobacteraceae bacterium]